VEISGLAAMIAMASGAGADGIARGVGAVKALLFLVLIEVLTWLSVRRWRCSQMPEIVAIEPDTVAKPETCGITSWGRRGNHRQTWVSCHNAPPREAGTARAKTGNSYPTDNAWH
jgi:hypothetical protein